MSIFKRAKWSDGDQCFVGSCPVAAALANAPVDDEPVTPSDAEAIAEGERDVKDGRVVSEAELRVHLGL